MVKTPTNGDLNGEPCGARLFGGASNFATFFDSQKLMSSALPRLVFEWLCMECPSKQSTAPSNLFRTPAKPFSHGELAACQILHLFFNFSSSRKQMSGALPWLVSSCFAWNAPTMQNFFFGGGVGPICSCSSDQAWTRSLVLETLRKIRNTSNIFF